MPVQRISVAEFLALATTHPVFDVRSPGEYKHAHIPGAHSLPLFTDEERKQVGTLYKQHSREHAIKAGLDFFGPKMKAMVEEVEKIAAAQGATILVHCWRGGMRSAAVSWLLQLYGFRVFTLAGGYKAYRNMVLKQFEADYDIKVLGGYTGSGKTGILQALQQKAETIIDLEKIAGHKGSAFGGIGMPAQPTQEMFENILATALADAQGSTIWLEDESQRIGCVNIPHRLWATMREKPVFFIEIPFEERLQYIVQHYGSLDKTMLATAIERIQKKLGPEQTRDALRFLAEGTIASCFSILLQYYDKQYHKSLHQRQNTAACLNKISVSSVDSMSNAEKLILCSSAVSSS